MIATDLQSSVERLGELIADAAAIVPFTGAGISTECGIPDFRSPGGLWTRNRPIPYDEFVASQAARDESWRRRFAMEPTFAAARPGRGHRALAALYRAGKVPGVITQNIDNLHQHRDRGRRRGGIARQHHPCPLHHVRSAPRSVWAKARFEETGTRRCARSAAAR